MAKYLLSFFLMIMCNGLYAQDKNDRTVKKVEQQRIQDSILVVLSEVIEGYSPKKQREFVKAFLKQYPEPKEDKTPPDAWIGKGKLKLLFNQSAFNAEWSGGGSNNLAGNLLFNYDLNYKHRNLTWDNQFRLAYGSTKVQDTDFFRKTDDNFEYNSVLGLKAEKNWYYSAFTNLKTQLDVGYNYSKDGRTRTEISRGFSPAFVQLGLGALWKQDNNKRINISPLAGRLIFVSDRFTVEKAAFGVEQGKSSDLQFGASVEGYLKFVLKNKLSFEHIFSLYSNYLEDPWNIDLNYNLTITMPITKHLNTTFAFQAIYDDDTISGFQIREVLAIGVNFAF